MSATPEQSIPQGILSKKINQFQGKVTLGLGVVSLASWLNFTTFPAIQQLFKTTQGGVVALTLTWLLVLYVTWSIINRIKIGALFVRPGAAIRKKIKWIQVLAAIMYVLGLVYVVWGNQLATRYFPREQAAVFINRIEGDNPNLQITERIRTLTASKLTDYEAAEKIKLLATNDTFHFASDDYKKIDRQFMSERYQRGLFAYGCYRVEDSSLSGHIYLKKGVWDDALKKKIVIPGIDSIRISVSRKTELLGNFIVALAYHEEGDYQGSNAVLEEILKDSPLLDYRFRYHCYQYRSLNFTRLDALENALAAHRKAMEILAARQCLINYKDSLSTLICGDGFQFSTSDSMYLYRDYVVIIHKLPVPAYSLLQCGSRHFTRRVFTSLAEVALTIDKIQQGETSPKPQTGVGMSNDR